MNKLNTLTAFALLISIGAAGALPASADDVRFGDGIHGRSAVVGFIGCDMHAAGGPEVMLVQFAREFKRLDTDGVVGPRCADALLSLQKRGLSLGQSRVVPQQTASGDDLDCLIWDIKDSNDD